MVREIDGKWGYSVNGELYHGKCDTPEQAKAAVLDWNEFPEDKKVWIGRFRAPMPPEDAIDAALLLEQSWCQDDYWMDEVELADSTAEQEAELTAEIRKVYRAWLEKYDLMPTHACLEDATIQEFTVGQLVFELAALKPQ